LNFFNHFKKIGSAFITEYLATVNFVGNKSLERAEQFKYLGTLTNQNSMLEKIKSRL